LAIACETGFPSHTGYLGSLATSPVSGGCETDPCPDGWFRGKKHSWVWIFTCTLDGLITALVDDAMQFSLEVGNIIQELVFLAVVISVVKADEPPGVDAVELVVDEALDISLQPLGLLAVFLMY